VAPPLASRYELGRELARGETSVVHEATDRTLGRAVAIKILRAAAFDAAARGRFAREARALAEVRSAHAVEILDVVDHDGAPAIVMERLDGVTLGETLRREGPFAPTRALRIAREILDALAAAHRAGIVHRRVEPSNVLLVRSPAGEIAKVIDFGLAGEAATDALTTATPFRRRPTHVAPEVLAGAPATTSSDVYSVGCILFEIATGTPLFAGDAADVVAQKLAGATAPEAPRGAPAPPADLARLVDALVAPMDARPRDADAALELFAAQAAGAAQPQRPPPRPLPPPKRRGFGTIAGVTLAGVVVAGVAGAVGAVVTSGREARGVRPPDAADGDRHVDAPPVAPPEAPTAAPPADATAPASALGPAPPPAARCYCKSGSSRPLCPTPRPPLCRCVKDGSELCRVPVELREGAGYCSRENLDFSAPSAKTGDACSGHLDGWLFGEHQTPRVSGALVCEVCYPDRVTLPRSVGVHGAPCRGYTDQAYVLDGTFDCR